MAALDTLSYEYNAKGGQIPDALHRDCREDQGRCYEAPVVVPCWVSRGEVHQYRNEQFKNKCFEVSMNISGDNNLFSLRIFILFHFVV